MIAAPSGPLHPAARLAAGGILSRLALALAACATNPMADALMKAPPPGLHGEAELTEVPFFPQERYQCGPAALATVLAASGVPAAPDQLVDQVYIPARQGTLRTEMVAAARRHGRLPYTLAPSLADLLREVRAGRPVLVFQNLGIAWYPQWHFAVVVGFDLRAGELVLRSGMTRRRRTNLKLFERTWARGDHWAMVVVPPGEVPATAHPDAYFRAVVGYERSGDAGGALAAYEAGLRRWPDHPSLTMGYASLRHGRGELGEAIDALSRLVASHPDYAPAHNNLASLLLQAGRPEAAERHARRAVALGGAHAKTYRQTLGEIRAARGD